MRRTTGPSLCRRSSRALLFVSVSACMAVMPAAAGAQPPGAAQQDEKAAKGPLRVHADNPQYLADGTGKAIYLTGSHTWGNLADFPVSRYPPFDYAGYLDFLKRYHHNFIRLWAGEALGQRPSIYVRTGPGRATDGEPCLDLARLNQEYFDRLRERVVAARDRGIYVGVMLFRPDMARHKNWPRHPFHPDNTVQQLNADTNGDKSGAEAYDLSIPRITQIQEEYVRKVVDTVNDLDNVLYEIGNEGDLSSVKWQYHFIRLVKKYEAGKPRQHPVGMTAMFDWVGETGATHNEALWKSPADWISPGLDPYQDDPPASDGSKVVIADVDHIWPPVPQKQWIWKCFTRGIHPIHMDWYTYGDPEHGISKDEQEAMRRSMGQTLRLADRLDLATMKSRGDLASTKYCLARPGAAYVIYCPGADEVTVDLSAARTALEVEWIESVNGRVEKTPPVDGGAPRTFRSPLTGDAVLYLRVVR